MGSYNDARQVQDKLTDLERRMRSIETASRYESASVGKGGITVYDGGTIDFQDGGSLDVGPGGSINIHGGSIQIRGSGDMKVDGTATFKSTTKLGGNTYFGGALNIKSGSLSLPSGSISNDALKEQLEVKYARASTSNFGLSTSWKTLATATITCPSWANKVAVMSQGYMFAYYTGQGTYGARIGGVVAGSTVDEVTATQAYDNRKYFGNVARNGWSTTVSNPGSSISANVRGRADVNGEMSTHSRSRAEIAMIAIFMR